MNAIEVTLEGGEGLRKGRLEQGDVSLLGGLITETPLVRRVDARGFRILPGIVDMHGDGFERHLAPRRGAMTDMRAGIASAEADLASNGITTAVMAQFYSWEGGLRSPEFARKFLSALAVTKDEQLTDMRAQLRIETHMLDDYPDMLALIAEHMVGYVVFNDHIPHKRLDEGRKPQRLTGSALKSGRSPEVHFALMKQMSAQRDLVPAALSEFARELIATGCLIGSHDDNTAQDRSLFQAMGAQISEFPETRDAAEAARATGGQIILGAPNVMRGGSHAGNVAADDLVREGLCDALASDYHYPALRQSVGKLVDQGACDFATAWALVSEGPARILGLSDRGTLEAGLRADVMVEEIATGRIAATISAGQVTYMQGEFAARMLAN
ncbi:alpha-D-ribose 1-methylphosphonate 5-triphosphate diphosphatase [Planktotalea sp.]|uniref:alpha-D-ribose 1-methylphosphonate 5-triphosphate diphosphatase n=1 Tax=Planktotalea sp. TaxID=2029877 RepID=UPI0025FF8518|nr:alpha-D-ribose 1-methylphosphonate 5-triphosphate diphosphatase [Planktotalea sp.]